MLKKSACQNSSYSLIHVESVSMLHQGFVISQYTDIITGGNAHFSLSLFPGSIQ